MIVIGLIFRASHGTLAGLCVMQLAVVPWLNPSLLTDHLAYAPIAMPLQVHACRSPVEGGGGPRQRG